MKTKSERPRRCANCKKIETENRRLRSALQAMAKTTTATIDEKQRMSTELSSLVPRLRQLQGMYRIALMRTRHAQVDETEGD